MSYAQRRSLGASRAFAIAIVTLAHASLGYALATGLALPAIQMAPGVLKTFNVEDVQPPPPEPRPVPRKVPESPPRVAARTPLVRANAPPAPVAPTVLELPSHAAAPPPEPTYPVQSAPTPLVETVPPRSATGDLQSLFRSADYPLPALERKEQGAVTVQLTVGVRGRVRACHVTSSSGSRMLDKVSCQILKSRALFTPARDGSGNLAIDTVSQEIRWVLH